MKKALVTAAILGLCVSAPALANQEKNTYDRAHGYYTMDNNATDSRSLNNVEQRRALQTKIERYVKKVDLNKDRNISMDEFASSETQRDKDINGTMRLFENTDLNGNGSVSSQEIMDAKTYYAAKQTMPIDVSSDEGDAYYRARAARR